MRRSGLAGIAVICATLFACGSDSSPREERADDVAPAPPDERPAPTDEAVSAQGETSAPDIAPETAAPEDACERAHACCPAYVAALPANARREANEACGALALATTLEGRPRDEACQGALEGFRSALASGGVTVPESCR